MHKLVLRYPTITAKSAESNFGKGPRRGAVAHVRRKVPIDYKGAPRIRPQKYPFSWTDRQTTLSASSVRPMMPNGIRIRFAVFSTMHWTDRRTYRPTDSRRESLTTIGRYATRATRPNNAVVRCEIKLFQN